MVPSVQQEYAVLIAPGQCVACAICVDVCPTAALRLGPDELLPAWRPELCTGCAVCERECPTAAIVLKHAQPNATP